MKFKKFKARKSNKRNGIKKAVNVALIIKIAVSAFALLTVLGVVGSMFSGSSFGSSSGSSGGGSAPSRPSMPGTTATDTEQTEQTEQTEETTPDVPDNPVLLSSKSPVNEDNFNFFAGATKLKAILDCKVLGQDLGHGVGGSQVMTERNGVQYVRIWGDGFSNEAFAVAKNLENKVTGKYLVFAYRLPTTNTISTDFQIYANTIDETVTGKGDTFWLTSEKDGKWHVAVIDLEQAIASSPGVFGGTCTSKFTANSDGTYSVNRLRLDWFNGVASTSDYIDVAYIGISDDLVDARAADPDYTGAEFTAEDFVQLDNFNNTVYYDNGMPYAKLNFTAPSNGEVFTYLHESKVILNGTSRYVAVMYRNAPEQYIEVHMNSTTKLTESEYYARGYEYYVARYDNWRLLVIELPDHADTVCRSLRVDFVNQNENKAVNMDIAFLKFFDSQGEAQTYYENYINTYNIHAE